jgi:hypothetical protein
MCQPGQPPGPPASAGEAAIAARADLTFLARADVASLPTAVQAALLRELAATEAALTAARAKVLDAFVAQDGCAADGHGSARAWLIWQTQITRGAAAGAIGWMRRLAAHPRVAAALADSEMSPSWARHVCDWTDRLPKDMREDADRILLAAAASGAGLADLAALAEEIFRRCARPDGDDGDDGFAGRGFRLLRHYRGASKPDGTLTPELTAYLTAALEALGKKAAPDDDRTQDQRWHDALEDLCRLALAAGDLPDVAGQATQVQLHLTLDQLRHLDGAADAEKQWAARRGAADADDEPGWLSSPKAAAAYACDAQITPIVTGHPDPAVLAALTADYLAGRDPAVPQTGPATWASGPPAALAPKTLRRLQDTLLRYAADVLSGPTGMAAFLRTGLLAADFPPSVSLPLDVGSAVSTVPPHLRRAVIARDRHCSYPGCRQRPARCQVHHLVPRSQGGATALYNLALMCSFHHLIVVHRRGWTLALNGDGTTTATSPDKSRVLHSHSPPPGAVA